MNLRLISITAHVLLVGRGTELKRQNDDRKHRERRNRQKEIIAFKNHTRSRNKPPEVSEDMLTFSKRAVHHPN